MPIYNKYEKYQKYVNGIPLDEYKQGELIGIDDYLNLEDCEEGAIYRWINTDLTVCNGYDLCVLQIKLKSLDGGKTWTDTTVVRIGDVIDSYSIECGYTPEYEWRPTGKYTCDNGFESEEFVYSYTLDGGKTWEIVQPALYKYELRALSNRCMMEAEPFSFVYDTSRPGGSLEFYNLIGGWTDILAGTYPSRRDYYGLTKYIIDWGDGSDLEVYEKSEFIESLEEPTSYYGRVVPVIKNTTVNMSSHNYEAAGKYTVKAWGFIRSIDIVADKLITWGTSGITRYKIDPKLLNDDYDYGEFELFFKKDCIEAVYIDGKRFMGNVILNLIEGFPEPSLESFKVLNDYDPEIYSSNIKRLDGHMRFGLENSNITEFDLSNVKVEEISLKNLPNLIRTPDFKKETPDIEGKVLTKYFQFYSIELCPKLKKAGPFAKVYNESLVTSYLLGVKLIDFFWELYLSSPDLEEIDFGYCGFVDREPFLERFKSLKTLSGYFYEGANNPFEGVEKATFKEMFSSSNSPIRNISNLIILGGDCTRMFSNNSNLHNHCKFESYELLGIIPQKPSVTPTTIIADYMFDRCNIFTIDFGKGIENVSSANNMFSLNLLATTIKGEITNNSKIKLMNNMFSQCSNITSISPLFKNYTKELPRAEFFVSGTDKLKTVPEDFFSMEGTGYPMGMFGSASITNYPIMDGVPVWEWERFKYNGEIAKTLCFKNCYYIRNVVPIEWGGGNSSDEVVFSVRGPIKLTNPNTINPGSTLIMYSGGVNQTPDDSELDLTNNSIYTIHVRYVDGADVVLPYFNLISESLYDHPIYLEISNFGNINSFYYINMYYYCYGFKTMGNRSGYYKNLYKTTTKLDLGVFASCTNIIEPSFILRNATNVNEIINFNKYGSYLSTEDKTKLLSPIHNLTTIDNLCSYSPGVVGCNENVKPTTTLNIFKNNPKLISALRAFYNCPITTVDPDELDNCPELTNVEGLFRGCNQLTNMPTFNGCKKITNFAEAFTDCVNLTGSTPVDENGYKLWERAGKPGYPATIDGRYCFHGCTKLDDYDEIPYYWK